MKKLNKIEDYRVDKSTVINLERGKIPPQAVDLEEVVLGALLIDRKGVDEVLPLIKSADVFYKDSHRLIYQAVQALYSSNQPIDLLTVSHELKSKSNLEKAGGDFYMISLTQKVSSSAHSEFHARILLQKYMKRQLIKMSSVILEQAYQERVDVFDMIGGVEMFIDGINTETMSNKAQKSFCQGLDEMVDKVEMLTNLKDFELTGVPTGFKALDELTGGWQNSDLIILAARPSMGKSALATALTLKAAQENTPVGVFSLEMSTIQNVTRLAANDSHFHLNQLFRKGFRDESSDKKLKYHKNLMDLKDKMYDYPIYINDTPALDIREMKSIARLWKRKYGIKLIIVDYLQLMKDASKGNNREQEISSISGTLKAIAKELDIPVIALSQLSRAVETRGGSKIPQLSDLRESGAIEQDADVIGFLWRPEYYDIEVPDELKAKGANTGLMIKKNRNGSLDDIGLYFDKNKTKFIDPNSFEAAVTNQETTVFDA